MCWPSEPSATGVEKPGSAQGGGSAGLRSWKFQAARTVLLLYWHLWEKVKFQAEPPPPKELAPGSCIPRGTWQWVPRMSWWGQIYFFLPR